MTTAKTVVDPTLIEQAKQLKREDVWAALPNPFLMVDLDKADCERAPAAYKDFFWDPRVKQRRISLDLVQEGLNSTLQGNNYILNYILITSDSRFPMTHFGILCPAVTGHLNPMLTLAQELKKRDHHLTYVGLQDARYRTLLAGLDFQGIGQNMFPLGAMANAGAHLGELNGFDGLKYSVNLFKKLTSTCLQEAPASIKALNIEALLIDQSVSEGGSIAEYLNIPFVTVCHAVILNQDSGIPPFVTHWTYNPLWWARLRNRAGYALLNRLSKPVREIISEYRKDWRLPPQKHFNEAYSRLAQISQQPAEFEFPRHDLPGHFHFAGPFHNQSNRETVPFPFECLTEKPLVYASLGTIQNRLLSVFHQIAEACLGLGVQLVISLGGGASPDSLSHLPGNPIVVDYAPQLELLKRAALTITHAGMNTTLESLSNAVPMVAIPITNDQPGIAARIS